MTNHPGIRAAVLAAASTLVLTGAACGANSTTATGGQSGTGASPTVRGPAGEGGTGDNGGPGSGSGDTGNGNGATKSATPKSSTSPPPGPKIVSFTVTQQPACPAKGPVPTVNYPGQDVVLSWKVTGATMVALSVDGPGIYRDTYKLEDMEQLGFGCDTSQPQSRHTYLLSATGNGKIATQTLTVSAPSNP